VATLDDIKNKLRQLTPEQLNKLKTKLGGGRPTGFDPIDTGTPPVQDMDFVSPVQSTFGRSYARGLFGINTEEKPYEKEHPIAGVAGQIAGTTVGLVGAGKFVGLLGKVPAIAKIFNLGKATATADMASSVPTFLKTMGQRMVGRGVQGAALGTAFSTTQQAGNVATGGEFKPKQIMDDALLFGGIDAGFAGVGAIGKVVKYGSQISKVYQNLPKPSIEFGREVVDDVVTQTAKVLETRRPQIKIEPPQAKPTVGKIIIGGTTALGAGLAINHYAQDPDFADTNLTDEEPDTEEFLTGAGLIGVAGTIASRGKVKVGALRQAVKFFQTVAGKVVEPEAKELISELAKAQDVHKRVYGTLSEQARVALKKQGGTGLFGNLTKADGIRIDAERRAGGALEIKQVLDDAHSQFNAVRQEAGMSPIGYEENYMSNIWDNKIRQRVTDDIASLTEELSQGTKSDKKIAALLTAKHLETQELIHHYINTKQAKSYAQAVSLLERETIGGAFTESWFEKTRKLDNPSWVYNRDARETLLTYIDALAKRTSIIKAWGKDGERATQKLDKLMGENPADWKTANTAISQFEGEFYRRHGIRGTTRKIVDIYIGLNYATKILTGLSFIPNLMQPIISTIGHLGVWKFINGGLRTVLPSQRLTNRQSGILKSTMMRAIAGDLRDEPVVTIVNKMGQYHPFELGNRLNLHLAASTAEVGIKDFYKSAQKGGIIGNHRREQLQRVFGIDWKQPLTKDALLEGMTRFAHNSQLQDDILHTPEFMNLPWAQPFLLFKRFGIKQLILSTTDMMYQEAKRGNIMPTLRMLSIPAIGGGAVLWARSKTKEVLSGEPVVETKPFELSFKQYAKNLSAIGAFGVMSDFLSVEDASELGTKSVYLGKPVLFSDIEKAADAYGDFMKDWEKYGDVWLATQRNIYQLPSFFGAVPRALGERLKTPYQQQQSLKSDRGKKRMEIIDAIIDGNGQEAGKLLQQWNDAYPNYGEALTMEDISVKEIKQRMMTKAKTKMKVKQGLE
jgi:hypothetical protein